MCCNRNHSVYKLFTIWQPFPTIVKAVSRIDEIIYHVQNVIHECRKKCKSAQRNPNIYIAVVVVVVAVVTEVYV